jgi:hypothetical protein
VSDPAPRPTGSCRGACDPRHLDRPRGDVQPACGFGSGGGVLRRDPHRPRRIAVPPDTGTTSLGSGTPRRLAAALSGLDVRRPVGADRRQRCGRDGKHGHSRLGGHVVGALHLARRRFHSAAAAGRLVRDLVRRLHRRRRGEAGRRQHARAAHERRRVRAQRRRARHRPGARCPRRNADPQTHCGATERESTPPRCCPPGSGWTDVRLRALNDRGQIVGGGRLNGQSYGFLLTPPEQATSYRERVLAEPSLLGYWRLGEPGGTEALDAGPLRHARFKNPHPHGGRARGISEPRRRVRRGRAARDRAVAPGRPGLHRRGLDPAARRRRHEPQRQQHALRCRVPCAAHRAAGAARDDDGGLRGRVAGRHRVRAPAPGRRRPTSTGGCTGR